MAMGIVSEKDFDSELSRLTPEVKREESKSTPLVGEVIDVSRGRGEGSTSVPDGLRKIIGEESVINGRQSALELAQSFGLSPSSVSAYANGATSTASYNTPSQPIKSHINDAKQKVAKRARVKLMQALSHITGDKLETTNARDLSGIAKDMSAIVKNMEPDTAKSPNGDNQSPTFIFYSPSFRKEEHFDTVVVKE